MRERVRVRVGLVYIVGVFGIDASVERDVNMLTTERTPPMVVRRAVSGTGGLVPVRLFLFVVVRFYLSDSSQLYI